MWREQTFWHLRTGDGRGTQRRRRPCWRRSTPKVARSGWWRKAAAVAMGAPGDVAFIPVGVIAETRSPSSALLASPFPAPRKPGVRAKYKAGSIEIVLVNGRRVTVDAVVDEE